jgi:hypothetical protein
MAAENDIFDKMDALLRKHHPGAFQVREDAAPLPPEQTAGTESPSENAAMPDSDIPVLTEVIAAPHMAFELDLQLGGEDVPVLTDIVEAEFSAPSGYSIELDLDPDYEHRHAIAGAVISTLPETPAPTDMLETEASPMEAVPQPDEESQPVMAGSAWEAVSEDTSIGHEPAFLWPEPPSIETRLPSYEEELAGADEAMPTEAPQPPAAELPKEPGQGEQQLSMAAEAMENPPAPTDEHPPEHTFKPPQQALISEQLFTQISDSLSEQVLRNIDQKLQQVLEKNIAPQLARTLDKALSSMLDQFSTHIEYTVRESITQELEKQLNTPVDMSDEHDSGPDNG